jgi:hypothetical protein
MAKGGEITKSDDNYLKSDKKENADVKHRKTAQ